MCVFLKLLFGVKYNLEFLQTTKVTKKNKEEKQILLRKDEDQFIISANDMKADF